MVESNDGPQPLEPVTGQPRCSPVWRAVTLCLAPARWAASHLLGSLVAEIPEKLDFCEFECPVADCDGNASGDCPYGDEL